MPLRLGSKPKSMGNQLGKVYPSENEVSLDNFKLLRVVGKGAFGKVRIVEHKDTGLTFALKYIRKDAVVRSENVRNIVRERRMLEHLNHPFLCNLRYSFQDFEYLYIIIDLMNGGDLRFHLDRKTFTEDTVRFWIAELGCALRYIHEKRIVHRDVKPENIMLDSEGHVHLADFNVASELSSNKLLTSRSGTLAYLAPEVFQGNGYCCEPDWWSLGVCFYECIYLKRPFMASSEKELSASVKQASPRYYSTNPPVSAECESAIRSLLCYREHRIGAMSFESFATHPFFGSLDFHKLEVRQLPPVFRPSSQKANFDATHDLEELLLEEAPLEARVKRNKSRGQAKVGASAKEIRQAELFKMLEDQFQPFDYTSADYDGGAVDSTLPIDAVPEGASPAGSRAQYGDDERPGSAGSGPDTPPWSGERSGTNLQLSTSPIASRRSESAERETNIGSFSRPLRSVDKTKDSESSPQARSKSSQPSPGRLTSNPAPPSVPVKDQQGKTGGFRGLFGAKKKSRERSPPKSKVEPGVLGKDRARILLSELR